MKEAASYTVRDGVAVIAMDNPPVNGLGHALRSAIMEGLRRAAGEPAVRAVVLIGSAKAFSGGADIREFNTPKATASPTLQEVNEAQDALQKPLVAAIGGFALGGGLELALACHWRVAAAGAQLGLPEVNLGILPGSGGTQRLPRLVPVEKALEMMTSGTPLQAEAARELGLVDEIVTGDLLEGALAFARRVAESAQPLRRVRDRAPRLDGADAGALFARWRDEVSRRYRGYPAPSEIVACVEAACTRPFDEGRRFERERFAVLVNTVESKALRHAFFAERQTTKVPDLPEDTPRREIRSAAVVGAGTMGAGIAMCFANTGIPVLVTDASREALERGLARMRANWEASAAKGRLSAQQLERRLSLVRPASALEEVREADIVIEAVFERMEVKQELFRRLDAIARPGAILATNTSTLDVNAIAAATGRPADVIGTHFFSPAHVMRLLEVVRGAQTAKDALATVLALARRIGKLPVVSGVCDGFIGNRMIEKYLQQSLFLLDEGCSPAQVDGAIERFGFAMGPFRMSDLAGLDIGWEIRKRRYRERPDFAYSPIADRLCEAGRFGQKTGKGWYRYEAGGRQALPDPEVDRMLEAHRREIGVSTRAVSDEEIVERLVWSLANEGARILEEGIALRASDIDVVYLAGYGFPRYRGGPMFWADATGLDRVLATIERFARGYRREVWTPAPLLVRLAREGGRFNG